LVFIFVDLTRIGIVELTKRKTGTGKVRKQQLQQAGRQGVEHIGGRGRAFESSEKEKTRHAHFTFTPRVAPKSQR